MLGEAGLTHEADQGCHREQVQLAVLSLKDSSPNRSHVSGLLTPKSSGSQLRELCPRDEKIPPISMLHGRETEAQIFSRVHCSLGQAKGLRQPQSLIDPVSETSSQKRKSGSFEEPKELF